MSSSATPRPASPFRFDDGAAYEQMMGRWSGMVALPFLDWLALPEALSWLDDGCGDGSFTEVLLGRQRPSSVIAVDPAPAQLAFARRRIAVESVRFLEGDAQALPLPDASVDVAVMALVLFFLSNPALGVQELVRVVRPGGMVAAYHWDLAGGGLPLQPILNAVVAEGLGSQAPPSAWVSSREASEALWRQAGLLCVKSCQFEVRRKFDCFEDYWRTTHGSPRLRDLFASLPPAAVERLIERVREETGAVSGQPLVLKARANAVRGCKG
jgi:SAM-dependent methyltransferase